MDNDFSKVKLSKLKKLIVHIEKDLGIRRDDIEVPMEYVITALFPDAYDNIKKMVAQSYINGFNDGRSTVLEDDCK